MLGRVVRKRSEGRGVRLRARRPVPFAELVLYYGALVLLAVLLIRFVPGAERAISAPLHPGGGTDVLGLGAAEPAPEPVWGGPLGRLGLALFAVFGAVALAVPVAWIYMHTRRLRFDPSLVQTIIVLPIVVAGVVLVVKNSLALAFALAGIVAGVRFRQKLNEPKDAVYVLLSLGIGLASAVQALDVAFAVSVAFNVGVLAMWRYEPGRGYAPARGPFLAMGDTGLLPAEPGERDQVRARAAAQAADMETDGILLVHAPDADAARHGLEVSLGSVAREWRMTEPTKTANGMSRFEVLLRLEDDADPVDLLAELEERWMTQIAAAEYIPFRSRNGGQEDDNA